MRIHLKSILAAFIFSTLFYSKSLGLNLILIALVICGFLFAIRKKRPISWPYLVAYLFTGASVFMAPSLLSIIAHFTALVILVGKSIASQSSIYISGFLGALNLVTASVANIAENVGFPKGENKNYSARMGIYLKGIAIASILTVVFVFLYRKANPIFEELIGKIDFSFVSVPWMLFTILGYVLFLHLLHPFYPKELIENDLNQGNDLPAPKKPFTALIVKKLSNIHSIGSIVFLALNGVLIFFLVTDVLYLMDSQITYDAQYSQSVHQGVYALMFSIVCAIFIILYFFRGDLNFYTKNSPLKKLTYTWILLNFLLVIFTLYKNYIYVEALGFTYKRIGVFVYLFLTTIGLLTTYWKVYKIKNFHFLLRSNLVAFFVFLVCASPVPWDQIITRYNLEYIKSPDISYLLDLSAYNSKQLYHYSMVNSKHLDLETKNVISSRYQEFLNKQQAKTWQEYTLYHYLKQ